MKVAFVTTYNAQNVKSWSGTPYYMSKALIDAGIEVDFIGNLEQSPMNFSFRLKNRLYNIILKKRLGIYSSFYEPGNLRYIAQQVKNSIDNSNADIILSPGALPIAYLDITKPIVLWSDATFAAMLNYYPGYSDFSRLTIRNCNLYEKNVLKRAQLSIFSSEWAAASAIKDYNTDPEKVKVLPYGANIQGEKSWQQIAEFNNKKSKSVCKLLFVGQEWERKGGTLAVEITKALNDSGIKAQLTVIGCKAPPPYSLPDYIQVLGFIDKSKEDGVHLINKLYSESHFFILPTIADCTPIVFSEANSFGLPVLTHRTGGIPSIIRNDINGKMFEIGFPIKECVEYIKDLFLNFEKYENFSLTSFNEYKTKLNWKVSVSQMVSYFENILRHKNDLLSKKD